MAMIEWWGSRLLPLEWRLLDTTSDFLAPSGVGLGNTPRSNAMTRARTRKADYPFTTEAPALPDVPKSLADVTNGEQAQAWFENKVVRSVRTQGYCTEALRIMDAAFGKPLDKVGVYDSRGSYHNTDSEWGSAQAKHLFPAYLDSEGVDCWGNVWRDANGYDRNGLDLKGRDKDGYDKDGRDVDGFDREGKDANGVAKNDPARYTYDVSGYNADGYNAQGYDRSGYNREGKDMLGQERPGPFWFDSMGYDVDGYNRDGYNRDGELNADKANEYRRARRSLLNR